MVLGGKTPIIDAHAAAEMGFSLVLYANAALQGAVHGMQTTLATLKQHGVLDESIPFSLAVKGRAALLEAGADLTVYDYDIGHWIEPSELRDASAWMNSL